MSPYGVWKGPRVTSGDGPMVAAGEACDAYGTEPGLSRAFTRLGRWVSQYEEGLYVLQSRERHAPEF